MANIYELKQEFDTLWSILEDELVEDAELEDAFANAQLDLADKLENCCKYIKNQESAIAGLKEEEKRLSAKRKAMENGIERLKKLMQMAMTAAGEKKIACGTFTTSIQAGSTLRTRRVVATSIFSGFTIAKLCIARTLSPHIIESSPTVANASA